MDKDEQSSGSLIRFKSPTFRETETQLLVKLIDKYKNPILIKSMLNSVTYIKDKAWAELTKEFNHLNTGNDYHYDRTTDVLKTKWDNLKRMARKSSKNVLEPGDESFHSEIVKDVIKICKAEVRHVAESDEDAGNGAHTKNPLHDRIVRLIQTKLNDPDSYDKEALPAMQDDDSEDVSLPSCSKESKDQKLNKSTFDSKEDVKSWDCNTADDSGGDSEKTKPSTAFSARDCRLLLHCVRQEKNVLFTNSPLVRKQKAWDRITRAFNRQSPTKVSPPELKKKFQNLKSMVSKVNKAKCFTINKRKKYEELSNDDGFNKKIKLEPKSDGTDDFDFENDEEDDGGDVLEAGRVTSNGSVHSDANHDPLSNGPGADSGLGLMNHSDNKEMDKLKMELLNYELETAKLQRKRIEDAIEGEKSARDLRALEASLRIRAARLEVLAAESKIPPHHPALVYTPEETRAMQYLQNTKLV